MIRGTMAQLRARAATRPPGYLEDVLARAKVEGDELTLTDEACAELLIKYGGARDPTRHALPSPIPRDQWPRLARWLSRRSTASDRGLGDTLARLLSRLGVARFKIWFHTLTGHDCGCADRQAHLNAIYPLSEDPLTPL